MGVVYTAYDPELGRKVAIKLLLGSATPLRTVRLLREAQALARLQHPNVIAVYDVGTFGGGIFVAMELVDGETLAEVVERRPGWQAVLDLAGRWRDVSLV